MQLQEKAASKQNRQLVYEVVKTQTEHAMLQGCQNMHTNSYGPLVTVGHISCGDILFNNQPDAAV